MQHRLIANSANPALNRWLFHVNGRQHALKVAGALPSVNTTIVLAKVLAGLGIGRLNRVSVFGPAPHVFRYTR